MDYDDMLAKGQDDIPDDVNEGERFEIPDAETKKEGNKTVITNFKELVDAFNRDPKHVSKFLMDEIGTAGHIEDRGLVLNGKFRRGAVNRKVQAYADAYVLCSECGKPDTEIVKEKGVELLKCQACGNRDPL